MIAVNIPVTICRLPTCTFSAFGEKATVLVQRKQGSRRA